MNTKFAHGQKVRFNKRCVLAPTVPRNAKAYTHAVLVPREGDSYTGAGVIEKGTEVLVVDYASHATGVADAPLVRVLGKIARCHPTHVDPV